MAKIQQTAQEEIQPVRRFTYHSDENKYGRLLALLMTENTLRDPRSPAQVRFDVYPVAPVIRNGANDREYISRIYVQREQDKDDTMAGRPYLVISEVKANKLHGDIPILIDAYSYDEKGRPQRMGQHMVMLRELPEVANRYYEFLRVN